MKRFATTLALVVGIAGSAVGTASAGPNTNVGVQLATITQTSVAIAPAVQFGGGTLSSNNNQSNAAAANFASINQWMLQLNH
jgi:hypothetical protein